MKQKTMVMLCLFFALSGMIACTTIEDIPQTIKVKDFNEKLLEKLKNEEAKAAILAAYQKIEKPISYEFLKKDSEKDTKRVFDLLKAVNFIRFEREQYFNLIDPEKFKKDILDKIESTNDQAYLISVFKPKLVEVYQLNADLLKKDDQNASLNAEKKNLVSILQQNGIIDFQEEVNNVFKRIVDGMSALLFFDVTAIVPSYRIVYGHPFTQMKSLFGQPIPLILVILFLGGIFFTLRYGFVSIRLLKHGYNILRGKYDNPEDKGEVTHFQALTSALSATVGLGNIGGVAVAISLGGPGAIFWMWVSAFLGMSLKFSECTFGQIYRKTNEKGSVIGGPMMMLKEGFKEKFKSPISKGIGVFLAYLFSILVIIGSFGGGNLFQVNQSFELLKGQIPALNSMPLLFGFILAGLTGVVIIGSIKRIGEVTSKLVPFMCVFYCLVCLIIIFANISFAGEMIMNILLEAFSPSAIFTGSAVGVFIQGVKRASFSNEAGIGSSPIAHAAAKTKEPVREGIVGMMEPFVDTLIVCTMTALAILITGAHLNPELKGLGAQITAEAFSTLHPVFAVFLTVAAVLFAYSTLISWSYYGEKGTEFIFGLKAVPVYRIIYVSVIIIGPLLTLEQVINFSDLMVLSMAFPNVIGMVLLSGKVRSFVIDYIKRLKSGSMKSYH